MLKFVKNAEAIYDYTLKNNIKLIMCYFVLLILNNQLFFRYLACLQRKPFLN